MSKGRKPLQDAAIVGDVMDSDALAENHQQLAAMSQHQQALVEQFGDGLPWHPDHYEAAIRIEIGRSAESFLRAGRMLLVARACSAHGEWGGMLRRLNLGETSALHMMAWARQVEGLSNPARVQDLQAAAGTIGKMIELSRLPDEQFQALADIGSTGELDLDDVANMTRDALRAAVRSARADMEAKDERITKLSNDVNKAEEKAAKAARAWKKASPDEQLDTLLREVEKAASSVRLAIAAGSEEAGLCGAVVAAMTHAADNGLSVDAEVAGILSNLVNDLRAVRDHDYVMAPLLMDRRLADWQRDAEG